MILHAVNGEVIQIGRNMHLFSGKAIFIFSVISAPMAGFTFPDSRLGSTPNLSVSCRGDRIPALH